MSAPTTEQLGKLAKAFNDAVDDLFLLNFGARQAFDRIAEKSEKDTLYKASLRRDPTPANDYLDQAEVYAAVLTRAGRLIGNHDLRNFVPREAKTDDMREALQTRAPSFAALCR